jgi:pyruvate/2-oxoglutarate dehydrogenase complex dihydrolipoamide dehydrogenase (E3) component
VILGQGVEGVELAEQCRRIGLDVTLTGRDSRLMQHWLDEALSARLQALLEDRGIRCHFDQSPVAVVKEADGYTLSCQTKQFHGDMILASTGIRGNPSLARELGIYGETGILVDAYCRTSQPGIYAAGDAVQTPSGWPTGLWHWAEYQGNLAALNMAGQNEALENAPTRLKCEPFGQFLYSMSYQEVGSSDDSKLFMDDPSGYLRIFSRRGRSIAALMEGLGKGVSKILDEGIKTGDSPEALFKALQKE